MWNTVKESVESCGDKAGRTAAQLLTPFILVYLIAERVYKGTFFAPKKDE
jgi:hypothetical protein